MPLYDYTCKGCGHNMTLMKSIDNRKSPEDEGCPVCSRVEVKLLVGTPAVAYLNKGSMKTTNEFNDRLKDMKKKIPNQYHSNLDNNIR